jgi:glutamine synthetase
VSDYIEDYHILQTSKEEDVMRAVRLGLAGAGIPVENSKGEWGPGQEEINVRYADALDMADRHVIIKNGIKEIAWSKGKAMTFMAKWQRGSRGLVRAHVHVALEQARWQDAALLRQEGVEYGMSEPDAFTIVAGQLKYAKDITYFLAPYINSYKRFMARHLRADQDDLEPKDNRTAGFRLCGEATKGDPHRMPHRRRGPESLSRLRRR